MPLVLEYRNTRADFLAHYELTSRSGDADRSARSAHYQSVVFWHSILMLAAFGAFRANQIFLMCILLAVGGWSLFQSLPYSRAYRTAVKRSLSSRPETRIKLEVHEDGLHETVEGIESFAPWTSLKSFALYREVLFIELVGNLWAIIPRSSVTPHPTAVDDLIRVLRDRGVKESPNQAVREPELAIQLRSQIGRHTLIKRLADAFHFTDAAIRCRLTVSLMGGSVIACSLWLLIPNQIAGTILFIAVLAIAASVGMIWDRQRR